MEYMPEPARLTTPFLPCQENGQVPEPFSVRYLAFKPLTCRDTGQRDDHLETCMPGPGIYSIYKCDRQVQCEKLSASAVVLSASPDSLSLFAAST